jgi:hypothetical protein
MIAGLTVASGGSDAATTATLVVAIIILALVVAALALVAATRRGMSRARADARRELDLLRRELGAGHRPLLVDVVRTAPVPPDMEADMSVGGAARPTSETGFPGLEPRLFDPRTVFVAFEGGKIYVSAPLRNVGQEVAVIDDGRVELAGPLIGMSEYRAIQRHHVPAGETTRVDFVSEYLSQQASDLVGQGLTMRDITWQLTVPYGDFAGQQRTVAQLQIVCRGDNINGPWVVGRVEQRPLSAARGREFPRGQELPREQEHRREQEFAREPRGDELPDERSPAETEESPERRGVRGERVVDLWGNPVKPKRRRR